MADTLSPTTTGMLAATAKSAFNNPAFIEAVKDTIDQVIMEWAHTTPEQTQLRETLWVKRHALEDVINTMGGFILSDDAEKGMALADAGVTQEKLDGAMSGTA